MAPIKHAIQARHGPRSYNTGGRHYSGAGISNTSIALESHRKPATGFLCFAGMFTLSRIKTQYSAFYDVTRIYLHFIPNLQEFCRIPEKFGEKSNFSIEKGKN